jgi:hypothetical protein
MPIADAWVKVYLITTEALLQCSDKCMTFLARDMPRAIAPHISITNSDQIAAKDDLTLVDRYAHTSGLDSAPPTVVNRRIVAKQRHAGAGT